jgi:hypothetical protein
LKTAFGFHRPADGDLVPFGHLLEGMTLLECSSDVEKGKPVERQGRKITGLSRMLVDGRIASVA